MLPLDLRQALLEDIQADLRLMLVDDERWRETNRSFSAAQQQQSLFKGQRPDPVAKRRSNFTRLLTFHDLYANHEAAAAHFPYNRVLRWPITEPGEKQLSHALCIRHAFTLQHVHGGQGSRDR